METTKSKGAVTPKVLQIAAKPEVLEAKPITNQMRNPSQMLAEIKKGVALSEKHEKLTTTLENLNSFELGSDRSHDSLKLRDSDGRTFETSNTQVISEVLGVVKKRCIEGLQQSEKELLMFSI